MPEACQALAIDGAQLGGHAAVLRPQPPGHRDAGKTARATMRRQRVQEGVGRRVVALAGTPQRARGGGEQQELAQAHVLGQLVQVQCRIDLGPQRPLQLLGRERVDHAIVERSRGVHHRAQRMLRGYLLDRPRQRLSVGRIARRTR